MSESDPAFDLGEPPQPAQATPYRVLARKYRPQTFSELIGQDAMVTTLENAIRRGRLAHAFLLTGIRGTGKTSTARLIAKALNCIGPDGQGGPTIDPCGVCEPCRSIAEGRNIDVIEMDAASHTGVDDMRAVIDAARLAAFGARFKIYIIDEVHMLSRNAFNALLKTLEEPPEHVKFLLATTEVNKVPVTVLSRCQRFDLRRIPAEKLAGHFANVVEQEGVGAEPEALALIARAAEGSARDGLSILDQAIAHASLEGGGVRADAVREMLGLSDRGAVRTILGQVLDGDAAAALASLRAQYSLGVDPQAVLRGLLETVHAVTLAKVGTPPDAAQPLEEQAAAGEWASRLSFAVLHRLWQLLLRGHDEVARAALPIEAAEMALLRVIHASTLPDPSELSRLLAAGTVPSVSPPAAATAAAPTAPPPAPAQPAEAALPQTIEAIVDLLANSREQALASRLEYHASVLRVDGPELVLSAARPLPADLVGETAATLKRVTGRPWKVLTDPAPGEPTIRDKAAAHLARTEAQLRAAPAVAAAFDAFPDAQFADGEIERIDAQRRQA